MESNVPVKQRKQGRSERLARKFKGCLRCEWCNRWTIVPMKKWKKLYDEEKLFPAQYTHYCFRPRCKAERDEIL